MKKLFTYFIFSGLFLSSCFALNEYKPCIGCHGVNGEKSALDRSKIINKMSKEEIIDAMLGYKNNTYGGPMKGLMKVQVKKLTDEEITLIAEFISGK